MHEMDGWRPIPISRPFEHLCNPLKKSAIASFAKIDILPFGVAISAAHHETRNFQTVSDKGFDPATHGRIGRVVSEEGNPGHYKIQFSPEAKAPTPHLSSRRPFRQRRFYGRQDSEAFEWP